MENSTEITTLKEDNERLKAENNKLVGELQRLININRVTYDRLTMVSVLLVISAAIFKPLDHCSLSRC